MNNNGQIASTLSWTLAFIIVFFIMLLFIGMTSILGLQKIGSSFIGSSGGFNKIGLEDTEGLGSLESQKTLFYLLNTPIDSEQRLVDLIVRWKISKDDVLKQEIEDVASASLEEMRKDECYFFQIDYNSYTAPFESDYVLIQKAERGIGTKSDMALEKSASKINIFIGDQKINTGLYFGGCYDGE